MYGLPPKSKKEQFHQALTDAASDLGDAQDFLEQASDAFDEGDFIGAFLDLIQAEDSSNKFNGNVERAKKILEENPR